MEDPYITFFGVSIFTFYGLTAFWAFLFFLILGTNTNIAAIPTVVMLVVSIVAINLWETIIFWLFIIVGCIAILFLLKKLWLRVHPFHRNNYFFIDQNPPPGFNDFNMQNQDNAFPNFGSKHHHQDDDVPINPNQNN